MKIISGIYKGRNLDGFNLDGTRPTMDRVKESLFAMIQDYLKGSVVLDLFSGSGNLGIESLSNGAKQAYLVDKNYKACNIIKKNISTIGVKDAEVLNMDYLNALKYFHDNNIKFDLIFLDPPYNSNYIEKSIEKIDEYDLLNENGLIIVENDSVDRIVYSDNFSSIKDKKYGDKWVVILKKL